MLLMDSARDDVGLAGKEKVKVKVPLMIEPPSILKNKSSNNPVFSAPIDHWEQNDISKLGHHIWAQPAAQAEVIGQRVLCPEFGPG